MRGVFSEPGRANAAAASSCASTLLRVHGLTVSYAPAGQPSHPALLGVEFDIAPGEIVGILGESGSGKSTLALSILGLLPQSTHKAGSILFERKDLLKFNETDWAEIRGARIAMVFQEPGLSLSPVMRAGDQIVEVLRAHRREGPSQRKQQVESILEDVGLVHAERIYKAYPHQLSGGELHRVAVAQALACRPDLLIAD